MKKMKLVLALFTVLIISISCNAQTNKTKNDTEVLKADKVEVYYFHYTRRCITCMAVEAESEKAVKELYGNKVSFAGYNLDEPEGEQRGKELGVWGQTLLIVKNNIKINLTNEGFMYARNNPEKLKQIIKGKIDPLM